MESNVHNTIDMIIKILIVLVIGLQVTLLRYHGRQLTVLENRVSELGEIQCSRMASFDNDASGYIYSLKDGCEIVYDN